MWDAYRSKSKKDEFSGTDMAVRCYESHPVLKLGKGRLYGGSASSPMCKTADVYVALQSGSTSGKISDPWDEQKVIEVQYAISDMQTPTNLSRFKKLVTWLCNQLHDGKTVHVGCIGGHGRSGLLISAIVAELKGEKDAIQWVRKNYCKKAVESKSQIQWLMTHYGVTEVEPTKTESKSEYRGNGSNGRSAGYQTWGGGRKEQRPLFPSREPEWREPSKDKPRKLFLDGVSSQTKSYDPLVSPRSLWKGRK